MIRCPKVAKPIGPALSALSLTVMAWVSLAFVYSNASAQKKPVVWSEQEKPILEQYRGLGALPDDYVRSRSIKQLALEIRKLPSTPNKLQLAVFLADDSTEGDFGHDTLQEAATTLEQALREEPPPADSGQPAFRIKNSRSSSVTSTSRHHSNRRNSRRPCLNSRRTTNAAPTPISR